MKLKQYKFDPYASLDASTDATMDEIKERYLELAIELDPNLNKHLTQNERESLEKMLCEANEAFLILSNPERRMAFDSRIGSKPYKEELIEINQKLQHALNNDIEPLKYKRGISPKTLTFAAVVIGLIAYTGVYKSCQELPKQSRATTQNQAESQKTGLPEISRHQWR